MPYWKIFDLPEGAASKTQFVWSISRIGFSVLIYFLLLLLEWAINYNKKINLSNLNYVIDFKNKMKYIEHAKEGLLNLYFSKLRSILALLDVLVGTASVVAMVLVGELASNEALKKFKSLGTDLLAVSIN